MIHVVPIADLARPAMAAPVMGDDAIPPFHEVEHLEVPVVGAQWPAMMEDDGLRVFGAPVLVIDRRAVLECNHVHLTSSCVRTCQDRSQRRCHTVPYFN